MQTDTRGQFEARIAQFEQEIKVVNGKLDQVAWIRLLVFGLMLGFGIWSFWQNDWLWMVIFLAGLAAFIGLVKWNERISEAKRYLESKRDFNHQEIDRLENRLDGFDPGEDLASAQHLYAGDLDLYGSHSLWQLLSRTTTTYGRRTLSGWMNHPAEPATIRERQEIARELAEKIDWRQDFQATGILGRDPGDSVETTEAWLQEPPFFLSKPLYRFIPYLLAPVLFATTILGFMEIISLWFALGSLLLNAAVIRSYMKHGDAIFEQVERKAPFLRSFSRLLQQIETLEAAHPGIKARQARLATEGKAAYQEIADLALILERLKLRLNGLPYFMMNYAFFWDIFHMTALERWKSKHKGQMTAWFEVIGEMEALASLAAARYAFPDWKEAEISAEDFHLEGEVVGHPLLSADVRVSNPIHIEGKGKVWLITGSNMSGKSTYLRTVGINVVLALTGAVVCADRLVVSPMQVATSMRTIDSLEENTSSFFAELKRLRMVLEEVKGGKLPVLFLLDEILKGTNSKDRHAGARALIRQLHRSGASGLVSTHDLELVALEEELTGHLKNYSFNCEVTPTGELNFDYALTDGVCKSMNAVALMSNMGIEM